MFGYKINQDDFDQYIEKMNNNELTVEDILDQDSIVRDLKTNSSSEFVSFLTNQNMKKLIDYVTKMPNEDDQKIGHKFPFNASEILCSNNMKIINKYFNEKNESEKSENDEEKNEDESKIEESENDDLLNYLFNFLNSESNDMNYVLIGYFNKIINHLLQNKSTELLNYIFNLHQEIFEGLIKHLNRRAIGETIKNILIYNEDNVNDLNLQRKKLIISIIQELNENQDEEKCFCICETIINCISNKEFFVLFMLEKDLVSLLYSIIYKNIENDKNLRTLLHLMIKINEKILSLFDNLVTPNLGAENENVLNYDNDFDNNNNENNENLNQILSYLFNSIIEGNFIFFRDLNQFDNKPISTSYEKNQKKLGIKKLILVEYLRSVMDIIVNTNAKQILSKEIDDIINIINNNDIFHTLNYILFNYEFNNIFQTLYLQLMTIILNENSPENLINGIFINNNPNEVNLITKLIDHTINNISFEFLSGRKANSCILSIEVKLINDIINSDNKYIKKMLENEKDLKIFHEVVISRLNNLFTKKLLYDSNLLNFNFNENTNENLSPSTQSIEEIINEDLKIYDLYKKGGNYLELQNAKIEREISEREKNNINKLTISQELINDDEDYNNDFNPYKEENEDINQFLNTNGQIQEDNSQKKNNILTNGYINDDDNENDDLNYENNKKDNEMKVEDLEDDFKIEENEDFKIEENDDDEEDNINVKEYLRRQKERQMTEEDEENDINDNKNKSDDDFNIPEYENSENKIQNDDEDKIEEYDIDNNKNVDFDKKNTNNHNFNQKHVKVNNFFKPLSRKEEEKHDDIYIQIQIESKDNSNEEEENEEEEVEEDEENEVLNNKKVNKKNKVINGLNEEEEKEKEDLEEEEKEDFEEEEEEKEERYLDRRNEIKYWNNYDNMWDLTFAFEDLQII